MTFWPSEELRTYVGIGIITIQTLLPFMILIICYGQIIWVLTRRINTDLMKPKPQVDNFQNCTDESGPNTTVTQITDTSRDKFELARRNTIKTLLIVGLCFIICWSQIEIMYLLYNCGYDINFNTPYIQFAVLLGFINYTVNPFIYLVKYRDYQEALRLFLHCSKK